jgi:hypothetical protein
MTKNVSQTLPHDVPENEMVPVLIRDQNHKGDLVCLLPDGDFLFASLDHSESGRHPRCVLVELASPKYDDESGAEVSDWQSALPERSHLGCDLESRGYALVGLDLDQEVDAGLGVVLWDSAGAAE